jgi:5-methylcytosine-specific restriction endonuclease McrA
MPVQVQCIQCGVEKSVIPARAQTFKFCSIACKSVWQSVHKSGENHPCWQAERVEEKICDHCGERFVKPPKRPLSSFEKQRFCSKPCADQSGLRHRGEEHPRYKEAARRRNRGGRQAWWSRTVISRDGAACQRCGDRETELQAHHIKSYADNPDLRWDVGNGTTLCAPCHWAEHAASDENGVNSGKTLTGEAEGNPEPSFGRKVIEGVTTRGRAYRRWCGHCAWCGTFISKRLSDAKGKKALFCGHSCRTNYWLAFWRKKRPVRHIEIPSTAVIPSTSAPRESDDIV